MNALTNILLATVNESSESGTLPSVFELYLVDQIDGLLKPAFHHAYSAIISHLPFRSMALSDALQDRWRETFTFVQLVAQYNSFKSHNRSLSEGIYGLTRVNIIEDANSPHTRIAEMTPLHPLQQDVSIAIVAVMPNILDAVGRMASAIRRRRQLRLERLREGSNIFNDSAPQLARVQSTSERNDNTTTSTRTSTTVVPARQLFPTPIPPPTLQLIAESLAVAFPYVRASYDVAVLGQRMLYCYGHSPYSHPFLRLINVGLVKNHPHVASSSSRSVDVGDASVKYRGVWPDWRLGFLLLCLIVTRIAVSESADEDEVEAELIPTRSGASALSSERGIEIPPPKQPAVVRGGVTPVDGLCPICRGVWRYPSVSTGGFVFCYSCLVDAVGNGGRCPVSGLPCGMENIIRLHN